MMRSAPEAGFQAVNGVLLIIEGNFPCLGAKLTHMVDLARF
jgi:hypothetical protein